MNRDQDCEWNRLKPQRQKQLTALSLEIWIKMNLTIQWSLNIHSKVSKFLVPKMTRTYHPYFFHQHFKKNYILVNESWRLPSTFPTNTMWNKQIFLGEVDHFNISFFIKSVNHYSSKVWDHWIAWLYSKMSLKCLRASGQELHLYKYSCTCSCASYQYRSSCRKKE